MSKELRFIRKDGRNYEQPKKIKLIDNGYVYQGLSGLDKNSFDYRIADAKFITYMDVFKNRNIEHASGLFKLSKSQNSVLKNDILFTASSETPEEVGIASVYTGEDPIYLNSFCFGWRSKLQRDNNYMVNMLASPKVRKSIVKLAQGSTRYNLSKERLSNLELPFHDFDEQQKIGSFLSAIDGLILKKEKLAKSLNKFLLQQIKKLTINKQYKEAQLADSIDLLDNLRRPLSELQRNKIKGSIPYYGANGLVDYVNDFIFNEELILLAEDGGDFNSYNLKPIAYKINGKSWVNNHAHVIRPKKNIDFHYLYFALKHKDIRSYITGSSRTKLNKSELLKIKLMIPDLKQQISIGSHLKALENFIDFQDKSIENIKRFKKYYLNVIFKSEGA